VHFSAYNYVLEPEAPPERGRGGRGGKNDITFLWQVFAKCIVALLTPGRN